MKLDEKKHKHKRHKHKHHAVHHNSGGYGYGGYYLGRPYFYGNDGNVLDSDGDGNSVGTDFGNAAGDYGGGDFSENEKLDEVVKLLETLTESRVFLKESAPRTLKRPLPNAVKTEFEVYKKYAATKDFVYYANGEGGILMYDTNGELRSDNFFAEDDLAGVLENKTYIWLSADAKYDMEQQAQQNNEN